MRPGPIRAPELLAAVPETIKWADIEVIQFANVNSPNIRLVKDLHEGTAAGG